MKKDNISYGVLLIISAIFIISVFSFPALTNIKNNIIGNKYDKSEENIINSAKSKYAGDINNLGENKEYTIKELIDEGYLKGNEINPLTGEKYNNDDKVIIITKNGITTYKFVGGKTISEIVKDSNGIVNNNEEYYFVGENPNNYISFNEKIYRIIKTNNNDEIYIINDQLEKNIEYTKINSYLKSLKNDNIKDEYKKVILSNADLLTLDLYNNTISEGKSYLNKDNYIWIKYNNELKVYDFMLNTFTESTSAWINPIIVIDGTNMVTKGDGSRVNPYCIY